MTRAERTMEAAEDDAAHRAARPFKKRRFTVFLVSGDDSLWPLVGADLSGDLLLKQLDSVEELLTTVPAGESGILLWDARNHGDRATALSSLTLHSARFAVIVLDGNVSAGAWTLPLQQQQIVAAVELPLSSTELGKALEAAREEVAARMALLGESVAAPATSSAPQVAGKTRRWLALAVGVIVAAAAAAGFLMTRHGTADPRQVGSETIPSAGAPPQAASAVSPAGSNDEKVDALIEKAQQAMLDRRFIDPAAGSALAQYRDVLLIDPGNGEALQGLQRLAEILVARVQSALDERKFDAALQYLETVRSIDPNDPRLSALDDRIASLRAELGAAQIIAATNAQNFDRAAQLIDDAARAKSLPAAKLAQLRDDVRRRRDDFELTRLLKLIDTRLQQDKLVEPRNDSAAFYLDQAKQAGAPPAVLLPLNQELQRRLALTARAGTEPKRFGDAQKESSVPRDGGAPASARLDKTQASDIDAIDSAKTGVSAQQPAGEPPTLGAMRDKAPQQATTLQGDTPVLKEQSLTRISKLEISYPYAALTSGIEGWVEIGFTVNPNGSVSNVAVLNSSPPRTFDQAGIRAVSKMRYQPVMQGGKAVAVTSSVRLVFRMPK